MMLLCISKNFDEGNLCLYGFEIARLFCCMPIFV